jgi:uncharacterized protein
MEKMRRFKILLGLAVALYVAACSYFWFTQDQKIFKPMRDLASDPGRLDMEFDRIKIDIGKGDLKKTLDAFWVPAQDAGAPAVLYLHGQDANIGKNLFHTRHLHQSGYSVLVVDYRGFGESFGEFKPSEVSVNEDAEAAWHYLTTVRQFPNHRVFIYGHSLGAAIAIELAIHHEDAGGLIAEGAFTSVKEMANWKLPVTRLLPVDLLLHHRFDSIEKIGEVKIPKLFIHGVQDEKVPCWMSEKLHIAAQNPKYPLLRIDGGGHADCCLVGLLEHRNALETLISESLDRSSRVGTSIEDLTSR